MAIKDKAQQIIDAFFNTYVRNEADRSLVQFDSTTNKIVVFTRYRMAFQNFYGHRPAWVGDFTMSFNVY